MATNRLRIVSLVKASEHSSWKELEKEWRRYFDLEHFIDTPENISKYLKKRVDILFLDDISKFDLSYYRTFKDHSQTFAYIAVKNLPNEADADAFKLLVDRIVYTGISPRYLKWTTISSLRRYWDVYSKPSTIIFKDLIADFNENKFTVNGNEIKLTAKEVDLLRFFLKHKEEWIDKAKLFKEVWGYEEIDSTRAVDQMIFKLKSKIGRDYFTTTRNKGIKFGEAEKKSK